MLSHLLQKRFSDSRILKLKNINTILHSNIDLKKKEKEITIQITHSIK